MKICQKQYELGFLLLNSPNRFSINHYFNNLKLAKSRKNLYPPINNHIPKKTYTEPFKDYETVKSLQKLQLRIDTINERQPLPKINKAFIEIKTRINNNKGKTKELANRALSLENIKFTRRIMNQEPRIMKCKLLDKLYFEKHEKYVEMSKRRIVGDISKFQFKLPKLKKKQKTELNNEFEKSLNLKEHDYKDITHQTQGHLDEQNQANNIPEKEAQ